MKDFLPNEAVDYKNTDFLTEDNILHRGDSGGKISPYFNSITYLAVKYKRLTKTAILPTYGTSGAAGFDIYSDENRTVFNQPIRIKTGIAYELPPGYGFFIIPRSGMASKELYVANTPGLLDSDYRGELMVLCWTPSHSGFRIKQGERIAQGFIIPIPHVMFEEVDELSSTDRGAGGFGSTGK